MSAVMDVVRREESAYMLLNVQLSVTRSDCTGVRRRGQRGMCDIRLQQSGEGVVEVSRAERGGGGITHPE